MSNVDLNLIPVDETQLAISAGNETQLVLGAGDDAQLVVNAGDETQLVLSAGDNTQIVLSSVPVISNNGLMLVDGTNSDLALGNAGVPSLKFNGDANTGIFSPGADQVSISTGGTERLRVDGAGQIEAVSLGSAAAPTFSFTSDPNTGIYSPGADQLAISTAGTGRLFVDASGNVCLAKSPAGGPTYSKSLTIAALDASIALRANSSGVYADQGIFFAVDGTNYSQIYNSDIGQLIFRTGSGLSERLRITSAGNVGIGTSAPATKLAVVDTTNQLSVTTGAQELITRVNSTEAALYTFQAIPLNFYTSNQERLRITASGLVGIGTTAPGEKLHIQDSTTKGTIKLGLDYYGLIQQDGNNLNIVSNGDQEYRVGVGTNNGSGSIVFKTSTGAVSNTERARIDSSGRLLVGTSAVYNVIAADGAVRSPGLQRAATTFADTTISSVFFNTAAGGGGAISLGRSNTTTIGTEAIASNGDVAGSINFSASDGVTQIRAAVISANIDGTPGANDMPGRLVFSTTADGAASPTERLRIDSTGQIEAGSLGTAAAPVLTFLADPNTGIYSPGADQLALSTGGTGRLIIGADGGVVVNTGALTLNATGGEGGQLVINNTTNAAAVYYLDASTDTTARLFTVANNTNLQIGQLGGTGGNIFLHTGAAERMRVTASGLVGIGTAAPSFKLDVADPGNSTIRVVSSETSGSSVAQFYAEYVGSGASNTQFTLRAGGNYSVAGTITNHPFIFSTNNTERARIDSSGRLLVGTSASIPGAFSDQGLLQVNGGAAAGYAGYRFTNDSGGAIAYFYKSRSATTGTNTIVQNGDICGSINFAGADGTTYHRAASITGDIDGTPGANDMPGRLVFSTTADGAASPTERMRITSAGLVGIGTTSPGNRLHVSSSGDVLRLDSSSTDCGILLFDSVGGSRIGTRSANIIFDTSSLERARIDSSGRLLVGTSSRRRIGTAFDPNGGVFYESSGSAAYEAFTAAVNRNDLVGPVLSFGKSRGTANGSNTIVVADDELGTIRFSGADGTDLETIGASITAFVDGTPGANDMPGRLVFRTTADGAASPTERMRITSAGLVGINKAPAAGILLDVEGPIRSTNGTIDVRLQAGAGGAAGVGSFSSDPLLLITVGNERARIDTSGRLLVGTSAYVQGNTYTASNLFHIAGGAGVGPQFSTYSADAFALGIDFSKSRSASVGTGTIVQNGDALGNILFNGHDGTGYKQAAIITAAVDGTPGTNDMPGRLVFSTTADGAASPTERLRIDSTGQIEANGLGSAAAPTYSWLSDPDSGLYSPGANQLAISTGGLRRLFIQNNEFRFGAPDNNPVVFNIGNEATGDRAVYADLITDTTYTDFGLRLGREGGANSTSFLWHRGTGEFLFLTSEAAPIKFSTSNVERLRITSAGLVGIGTSSPKERLDVTGGPVLTQNIPYGSNQNAAYLIAGTTSYTGATTNLGTYGLQHRFKIDGGGTARITVDGHSGEFFCINDVGRVGIGTTSPGALLETSSAASGTLNGEVLLQRIRSNASNNVFVDIKSRRHTAGSDWTGVGMRLQHQVDATAMGFIEFNSLNGGQDIAIGTGGSTRLLINSTGLVGITGNVGIGTTAPVGILDVVTGTNRGYFDDSSGNLFRLNAVNAANSAYAPLTVNGSVLTFQIGAAERARIDSSGRLLVGTSASTNFIGTAQPAFLQLKEDANNFALGLQRASNDNAPPNIAFRKTRATTDGGVTVVADGDTLGQIRFIGTDGTGAIQAATIRVDVDGNPGTNDMPGRLVFSTTADGASSPTERLRIGNAGTATLTAAASTTPLIVNIGASEVARITAAGRMGIGASSPGDLLEINSTTDDTGLYIRSRGANNRKAHLFFLTLNSIGGNTGATVFHDGSGLAFNTGTNTAAEVFRFDVSGARCYNQAAPAAVNATATLTVANLRTGIITSTSAAATDMTLPTGTDTQAGFGTTYDNFTFEWSVINTGPSLVRVLAGTAHTIVGSGSVATGTSGRFASRRTAANTFVTYRLT